MQITTNGFGDAESQVSTWGGHQIEYIKRATVTISAHAPITATVEGYATFQGRALATFLMPHPVTQSAETVNSITFWDGSTFTATPRTVDVTTSTSIKAPVAGRGTRVTDLHGVTIHGIRNTTIIIETGKPVTAALEIVADSFHPYGSPCGFVMAVNPDTGGYFDTVKRIEFADGSVFDSPPLVETTSDATS